jgi:hypothetical protein
MEYLHHIAIDHFSANADKLISANVTSVMNEWCRCNITITCCKTAEALPSQTEQLHP